MQAHDGALSATPSGSASMHRPKNELAQQSGAHAPEHAQDVITHETSRAPNSTSSRSTKDRPCDACRRRKTRCVKEEDQQKCVLCKFHNQECTFIHDPIARNRKRKTSNESPRRAKASPHQVPRPDIDEYDEYRGQTILRKTLGLMNKHHAHYIGFTEPVPFPRFSLPIGSSQKNIQSGQIVVRRVSFGTAFTVHEDQGTVGFDSEAARREAIQQIVGPYGTELVHLYFRVVHPSFPILHKGVYIEKYERSYQEFTAASLGAVYLLASSYWAYSPKLADAPKPDLARLWSIALESFDYTIFRPKLSSVQAGLLLAQYESADSGVVSNGSRGKLTAHLVSIAHEVGLHLDPANWDIPAWEVSLRRRLAWALYMQDKWVALVEGRPALISNLNWSVELCQPRDFPDFQEHDEEGSSEVVKGRTMFIQMVTLTHILADLLDIVFSLKAYHDVQRAPDPLRMLLGVVQPLQIRLKQWYASMRETLRMDNAASMKLSSTGYLRLAYLVLEVSIHRRIICQTCDVDSDPSIVQVCRSAACARFLSALEFVDSLKAQHLTSFWYFSSSPSLSLVISLGNLLMSTASDPAERQFYLTKLKEFRWTLKLNAEAGAKFFKPALAAMIVDPDELCTNLAGEPSAGINPAATVSSASHDFIAPTGLNVTRPTLPDITATSRAISMPMSPWPDAGAGPGFDNIVDPSVSDLQYVNAFAWLPPGFDGKPHSRFSES